MLFAERLTGKMLVTGFATDLALAIAVGVSPTTVSNWRAGALPRDPESWHSICSTLHTSSDYLLGLTDDPAPAMAPGIDPADLEADRYARTADRLAGRKRHGATYLGGWHRSADEGDLVVEAEGRNPQDRLRSLFAGWLAEGMLDIPRYWPEVFADVAGLAKLTLGELRWLCGHVQPTSLVGEAETLPWWYEHLSHFRSELERTRREEPPADRVTNMRAERPT
jgi:hypothetical protein